MDTYKKRHRYIQKHTAELFLPRKHEKIDLRPL